MSIMSKEVPLRYDVSYPNSSDTMNQSNRQI